MKNKDTIIAALNLAIKQQQDTRHLYSTKHAQILIDISIKDMNELLYKLETEKLTIPEE